ERSDRKHWSLGYDLEHRFNSTFKVRQNVRYTKADAIYRSVYNSAWADPGTYRYLARGLAAADVEFDAWTIDNHLQADFKTGHFGHKVLLGFDYQRIETDTQSAYRFGTPGNYP